MRFGVGKDIVTPDVRMSMGGYGTLYGLPFLGIHDDLYVKTLVLEDDATRVALVTSDTLMDDFAVCEALADYAQTAHGIPREHLIVSYTHTHCGPAQRGYNPWEATQYYEDFQLERMKASLNRACVTMREGRLSYGVTTGDWNISRRRPVPGEDCAFEANLEYPHDRDLGILRLQDREGADRALLVNYSCHPVTMGASRWLSAEYPGRLCQLLEARYYGATALFFQGAGGCTRPLITAQGKGFRNCTPTDVDGMARSMAAAVEDLLQRQDLRPVDLDLAGCWFTIPLPTEKYPREYFEQIVADPARHELNGEYAARWILEHYDEEPVVNLHAAVLRLSPDLYVAFLCGEVCYEVKQVVQEVFPGQQVLFVGYGDGTAYIPGDRMLKEGGYEANRSTTEFRLPGKFRPGLNERFRQSFAEARRRLGGQPSVQV